MVNDGHLPCFRWLEPRACNIQVVRQLDSKFGCIVCMHDMVYTSCIKQ
jgi:hypothetical protein